MEYVVGAVLTLFIVAVANSLISKRAQDKKMSVVRYSQSYIYSVVAPMMFGFNGPIPKRSTQANNYQEEAYVKIVVVENKAYFIKNSGFYVANVVEGDVDKDSTKEVDTMSMNDVELKNIMYIVEVLTGGDRNDSGGTSKS
jgi:hypothetical protein